MTRECPITGKSTKMANRLSNRIRATKFNPCGKVRRKANMQKRRIFVPELNTTLTVDLSTKGLKTLNKNGAYKTLKKAGVIA
jgi:large subunit ribosomal protein L28